jgi:molybdenum cofactor guanylyltransferase
VAGDAATGILLVGGESRRFGSPKALARLDGETLAEHCWRLLGEAFDECLALGKTSDELQLPFPVLDDGSSVRAPIAGIVAGLRAARNDVCVFLPVDCPFLSPKSLQGLAAAAPAKVPTGPLPAAYVPAMLPLLERKLATGDFTLRDVEAAVLNISADELVNINTVADLKRASAASP